MTRLQSAFWPPQRYPEGSSAMERLPARKRRRALSSRRDVLKAGVGIAGIVAAGKSPAVMIALRNSFIGPRFPYDKEVEYLESTGVQCINSGVPVTPDVGFYTVCEVFGQTSNEYPTIVGAQRDDSSEYMSIYEDANIVFSETCSLDPLDNSNVLSPADTKLNIKINYLYSGMIEVDIRNFGYNNIACVVPNMGLPIGAFCAYTENGAAYFAQGRIYSLKISKGNVIVRDFVPVRFTNELGVSEGALYDRANPNGGPSENGLYRNEGSQPLRIGE